MSRFVLSAAVGLVFWGGGCATAPPPASVFPFLWEGAVYEIVAIRTGEEPVNDLVRRGRDRVVLRLRDRDQDGRLDTLLVGSMPISEANVIYAAGIEEARSRGAYRVHEPARTYTRREGGVRLVVWSVAEGGAGWSNRFARYDASGTASVYEDADADGRLDDAPEAAQREYERVLEAGVRDGRVETVDSRVIVVPAEA